MNETPIKARRGELGKLKAAYFWPVYGEQDEVCFPFFESRRAEHVEQVLSLTHAEGAIQLSDGYGAYAHYAEKKTGITHAQCRAHTWRKPFEAQDTEPAAAAHGLDLIGGLYAVEARLREQKLSAAKKLDYPLGYSAGGIAEITEIAATPPHADPATAVHPLPIDPSQHPLPP